MTPPTRRHCPRCRQPTLVVVDAPVAGIPVTVDPTPTTAAYAALAITAGYRAVIVETDKRGVTYHHLNPPRQPRPGHPHHVEHVCGHTPPPAPPPPKPQLATEGPTF